MAMAILLRFVIIIITIISTAILVLSAPPNNSNYCKKKCPCENPMFYTLHLPGPTKTQFYMCNFGVPVLMTCGPGTHFDPALQVCNWPSAANAVACGNKPPYCSDEGSGSGSSEEDH